MLDKSAAFARFTRLSLLESQPKLRALLETARARGLPHVIDDTDVTLGAGAGAQTFSLRALPAVGAVPWQSLHDIPTALVTGSNGKTTTVRLLAACARGHGWRAAYNCTDGVFLDAEALAHGDYSGPAGARMVLREPRAQAAILETARGGILRRGIAMSRAHVAIVTNVSPDHFGEYGIHDLTGLADVKISVAAALGPQGLLVLNADDPQLRAQAAQLQQRFGQVPPLELVQCVGIDQTSRTSPRPARGGSTCSVRGRVDLHLNHKAQRIRSPAGHRRHAVVDEAAVAAYNIGNMAGSAALAAIALGIEAGTIAAVRWLASARTSRTIPVA